MDNKPIKLFPCTCMVEGLVAVAENDGFDDCQDSPFIDVAFFEHIGKFDKPNNLSYWRRICYSWRILMGESPWTDMVILERNVAKSFANHILYLIRKHDEGVKKITK